MSNLLKRTLSGILLVALMTASIILDPIVCGGFFLLIMILGLQEFFRMAMVTDLKVECALALCIAAALFVLQFGKAAFAWPLESIIFILALLVVLPVPSLFRADHASFGRVSYIYAGLLYIAMPIAQIPFLVIKDNVFDGTILLSFFLMIWMADVGAYCIGSALGQREGAAKLAPSISPKKSWAGFWGAVVMDILVALLLHWLTWLPFSIWHCIALGVIISVASVCGDLVESLWKRYFGVKDSGNLIPGHGGILDRFDSALLSIPLASIYLIAFGLL